MISGLVVVKIVVKIIISWILYNIINKLPYGTNHVAKSPLDWSTVSGVNTNHNYTSFNIVYTVVTAIVIFRLLQDHLKDKLGQDELNPLNPGNGIVRNTSNLLSRIRYMFMRFLGCDIPDEVGKRLRYFET